MLILYMLKLQIIGEYYKEKNALEGINQPVEFESDSICLDIPRRGVTTSDKVWKIQPLGHPQVS